jgi:hypothetical protein
VGTVLVAGVDHVDSPVTVAVVYVGNGATAAGVE